MKKFLNGLLTVFLLVVIVGGVGYIGYNYLYMNHGSMNLPGTENQQANDSTSTNNSSSANGQQNMQHGAMNNQTTQQNNGQSATGIRGATGEMTLALQNKDSLNKATYLINESIRLMTLDPYAPKEKVEMNMGNMQPQTNYNPIVDNTQPNNTAEANSQGNTTINVYPPADTSSNTQMNASTQMGDMGITYDANKMEQLHTGLYKLSVGMQLLEQLNNELVSQAEQANQNTQNLVQYYSNQYNMTLQNKNKLNQALNYVNEAANLVNINPYVSANGLVFDKDKMQQIHQSVFKLAQGVGELNKLGDDFTKQAVYMANMMQNYMNNPNLSQMNHGTSSTPSLFGGIFNNISIPTVVNATLVLFAIAFILGILGSIFNLLKPSTQKDRKEASAN
ncbi:hypothetical protein HNQ80_001070 [Anaerosolibacter carboniphilus]|uniref:Uncharacterized protein n=1 Tax=Anaerosolibacter carboniphilus TaxID=1417629 RepID=A0A841KNW9_9FIRM|nr:hypothetical protein [Anaerosolibacter carboniphilus]MBB6214981.1 hypothetical protein [Anaerosolibacter carboniphilus]